MNSDQPQPATAVVLAAGLGTRMRSALPKVLHPICGRPMLAYVIDAAIAATGRRPLVVISPATDAVREVFAESADFAIQDEPRGTADAVRAALDALAVDVTDIIVLSGDVPLVDEALVRELLEARRDNDAAVALITVATEEPASLGRIVRDERGRIERVVEARDASADEIEIDEINAGLYAFDVAWLRARLPDVQPSPVSDELYLPELIPMAREDDRPVATLEIDDDGTLLGINDRSQLAAAELEMRLLINERHLLAGVTMIDPTSAVIDASVEIAQDVTIESGVILRGDTHIERGTQLRAGTQIFDSSIGEDCVVWASVIEDSIVERDVTIGPFSHVRKGAHIEQGVELGNYAEVKNSQVGAGTKSHHFSYLGDADVGERVNIGAGTITANYDGVRKHRTTIGDDAFIGSDTILRAPVTVGEGSITGAGSVVTKDVPAGKMALGLPARIRERHPPSDGDAKSPASSAEDLTGR